MHMRRCQKNIIDPSGVILLSDTSIDDPAGGFIFVGPGKAFRPIAGLFPGIQIMRAVAIEGLLALEKANTRTVSNGIEIARKNCWKVCRVRFVLNKFYHFQSLQFTFVFAVQLP